MPFRDLRQFIAHLEERNSLRRIRKPVDIKYEIAAYIRKTSDIKGPALLFENAHWLQASCAWRCVRDQEKGAPCP